MTAAVNCIGRCYLRTLTRRRSGLLCPLRVSEYCPTKIRPRWPLRGNIPSVNVRGQSFGGAGQNLNAYFKRNPRARYLFLLIFMGGLVVFGSVRLAMILSEHHGPSARALETLVAVGATCIVLMTIGNLSWQSLNTKNLALKWLSWIGVAYLFVTIFLAIPCLPSRYGHGGVRVPQNLQIFGDVTLIGFGLFMLIKATRTRIWAGNPSMASTSSQSEATQIVSQHAVSEASGAAVRQSIETITFSLALNGYSVSQVDAFLEKLRAQISPGAVASKSNASELDYSPLGAPQPQPSSIQNTSFSRELSGYNTKEVDTFLARIATQLDSDS